MTIANAHGIEEQAVDVCEQPNVEEVVSYRTAEEAAQAYRENVSFFVRCCCNGWNRMNVDIYHMTRFFWALALLLIVCEMPGQCRREEDEPAPLLRTGYVAPIVVAAMAAVATATVFLLHALGRLPGGFVIIATDCQDCPVSSPVYRAPLLAPSCTAIVFSLGGCALLLNWLLCSRLPLVVLAVFLALHGSFGCIPQMGTTWYWRWSYSGMDCDNTEEWFLDPEKATDLVWESSRQHLQSVSSLQEAELLILGCGTSELPVSLARAGECRKVVATDIVPELIQAMSFRHSQVGPAAAVLEWQYADATSLPFEDKLFDVVIEKGTFAAIACVGQEPVEACLAEARRVLRPGGLLVSIWMGHSNPAMYLGKSKWKIIKIAHHPEQPQALVLLARREKEAPLPQGWKEIVRNIRNGEEKGSSKRYYFNEEQNITQWARPTR